MTNVSEMPRDADGFVDMDALPDEELDPAAAADLDGALAESSEPELDDATWQGMVDRAVDPDAVPVDESLAGPDEDADGFQADDPFGGLGHVDSDPSAAGTGTDDAPEDDGDDPVDTDDPATGDDDARFLDEHVDLTQDDAVTADLSHDDLASVDDAEAVDSLDTELRDHDV